MRIIIPQKFVRPILVASTHALTDLGISKPSKLAGYALAFFPMSSKITFPIFILSSIYHFAQDCNWLLSLGLHLLFFFSNVNVAWSIFCFYFCGIHCPLALMNSVFYRRYHFFFTFLMLFLLFIPQREIEVSPQMQLVVIIHIVLQGRT